MQQDASINLLNTSLIIPNKYQPRKIFDEKALNRLAESIKIYGIINPILVRKKDDKYEIIAGERRFRAAQLIGLTEVPVIIKNANEQQMAELALIENIQRQGLSPIEEAKSYEEIMRIGNQTQQSLAEKIGKSQSSIANKIRLLSLPQEIQDAIALKKISERHARCLLTLEENDKQIELLNRIIQEKLTVKETEQIINTKEVTENEIKQAISDIMKSLNIKEDDEEKEEKDDKDMNNGNFFPNFDNNNVANSNASLNMMNMQSMNQAPVAPEQEMVMPTMAPPVMEQPVVMNNVQPMPQPEQQQVQSFEPFGPQIVPQPVVEPTTPPVLEQPVVAPLFNAQPIMQEPMAQPIVEPQASIPMVDEPLFNPGVIMPQIEPTLTPPVLEQPVVAPEPIVMEQPVMESIQMPTTNTFEVPVEAPTPTTEPVPSTGNQLSALKDLLTNNGFTFKTYSNDTNDCIIIELPRN